jgi:hypothetical protein
MRTLRSGERSNHPCASMPHGCQRRLLDCLLGDLQIGCPLWVTLQGLDSFPIIFGHLEQALTLKVEGSDGRVLSAGALESAEFL